MPRLSGQEVRMMGVGSNETSFSIFSGGKLKETFVRGLITPLSGVSASHLDAI